MKPGTRDKKYHILITGKELQELKRYSYTMAESFGLDRRVMNYQGKRPLGLYRWDIECLLDTIADEIKRTENYPSQESEEYQALSRLCLRLKEIYREIEIEDARRK
jgi:hypothetical protein